MDRVHYDLFSFEKAMLLGCQEFFFSPFFLPPCLTFGNLLRLIKLKQITVVLIKGFFVRLFPILLKVFPANNILLNKVKVECLFKDRDR